MIIEIKINTNKGTANIEAEVEKIEDKKIYIENKEKIKNIINKKVEEMLIELIVEEEIWKK